MEEKLRRSLANKEVLVLDGAMGSLLPPHFTDNDIIDIHKAYIEAGADCLTTSCFNLDTRNLDYVREYVEKSCRLLSKADPSRSKIWFGSLGPIQVGELGVTFDEAVKVYRTVILTYLRSGINTMLVETCNSLEALKAILYVTESINQPVSLTVSLSTDSKGMLMDGNSVKDAYELCEIHNCVVAFGVNCGASIEDTVRIATEIQAYSKLPLICYPNNGLPIQGVYTTSPEEFVQKLKPLLGKVAIVGGCCGTTPRHIRRVKEVDWYRCNNPILIGEKCNANGSIKFRKAIAEGNLYGNNGVIEIIDEQIAQGAHYIDFNVDHYSIENKIELFKELAKRSSLKVCVDSSDTQLLYETSKMFNTKLIINSIAHTGSDAGLEQRIKKFVALSAQVIVRAQTEELGFGKDLKERIEILHKIAPTLVDAGYKNTIYDICIKSICLDENSDREIEDVKELVRHIRSRRPRLNLVCGLSNVSFAFKGKPTFRSKVNRAFAEYLGLEYYICNPKDFCEEPDMELMEILNNGKNKSEQILNLYEKFVEPNKETYKVSEKTDEYYLYNECVAKLSDKSLEELLDIMTRVCNLYDRGVIQLIHLLRASKTVKKLLPEGVSKTGIKGIICTVEGDIHDIGKDIVREVMIASGIEVIDLGVNVSCDQIIDVLKKEKPHFVGLSGLISESLIKMKGIVKQIDTLQVPLILLGGAVLDQSFADDVNSTTSTTVKYAGSPTNTVNLIKEYVTKL